MTMITALSGTISGECLFYKENGGYQNEDIWKKQQFTGKRTLNRLLAYQKEAEKIIRKQPSRHMIRKG